MTIEMLQLAVQGNMTFLKAVWMHGICVYTESQSQLRSLCQQEGTLTPPDLTALTMASRWRMTPLEGAPAAMAILDLMATASACATCAAWST